MKMSNKAYDVMKWVVLTVLPAMATLYGTLAKLWNFPLPTEVCSTITALTVFLGVVLQISSAEHKAEVAMKTNTEKKK